MLQHRLLCRAYDPDPRRPQHDPLGLLPRAVSPRDRVSRCNGTLAFQLAFLIRRPLNLKGNGTPLGHWDFTVSRVKVRFTCQIRR